MSEDEDAFYIYPGQPFIGEAIIHLLLAFNNEPNNEGRCSPREMEHSQIAYALIMIALESIVKVKLNEKDVVEPEKAEDLFKQTIERFTKEHGSFELWTELKILRNYIIHSAYFERSTIGGYKSKATKKKLESRYYLPYIDQVEECTNKWRLSINPLNVSRYEPLVSLMFFYWYGKQTSVWKSNQPLDTPDVDCRVKYNIHGDWINRDDYHHLVGNGNDFIHLIGYLSGRLSEKQRNMFVKLVDETLGIDLKYSLQVANGILQMFRNQRPNFD